MGNKNDYTLQDCITIDLPMTKSGKLDIRTRREKKIKIYSISDIADIIEMKKPRRETIAYVAEMLASHVRERFLKWVNDSTLEEQFTFFQKWNECLWNDRPSSPILECFKENWISALGRKVSWFSPSRDSFSLISRTIPQWKIFPGRFQVIIPFAGSGIGSYFFSQYFGAETQSSDLKLDTECLESIKTSVSRKDSYRWVKKLPKGENIILLFLFPPRQKNGRGWRSLSKEDKSNVSSYPSDVMNAQTDIKILDHVAQSGRLCWVIFSGCPSRDGSRGLHTYLNTNLTLMAKSKVRESNWSSQFTEMLEIYQYNRPKRARSYSLPTRPYIKPPYRKTILSFIREEINS